jgi:hypothetical protein
VPDESHLTGSAPPAPTEFVGRAQDLAELRKLLAKNLDKSEAGLVNFSKARLPACGFLLTEDTLETNVQPRHAR